MRKPERYKRFIEYFSEHQPDADTELHYKNPYELIVAVILSAQCTDKRVNLITPELFKSFPTAEKLAEAEVYEIYEHIKSCSYPNNKAKHLKGMAEILVSDFHSTVPNDPVQLQKMPGVGRKTAHVIASVVFAKAVMPVDTHVFRVADRIGLTYRTKTPLETEKQLMQYLPKEKVHRAHHWLILHGRYICKARTPMCKKCGIKDFCRYFEKNKAAN